MRAMTKARIADAAIEYAEARRYYERILPDEVTQDESMRDEETRAMHAMYDAEETMLERVREWLILQSVLNR